MAPKIKLTYFDIKGRAEPIRLAFAIGGVEFEDERIGSPEFKELKTSGKLTFGSLPVMEIDGEMFGESGAMLRYAGNVGGLTPKCPVKNCLVDMVIDAGESFFHEVVKDSSPEGRAKCADTVFPRYFGPVDSIIAKSDGPFLLGNDISVADIKIAVIVQLLKDGFFDHIPTDCIDKYTNFIGIHKAVMEHERVKKYYASK